MGFGPVTADCSSRRQRARAGRWWGRGFRAARAGRPARKAGTTARSTARRSRCLPVAEVERPRPAWPRPQQVSDGDHWNLATWAADVEGLGGALGIERPIVLRSSFGGFVAQKYAATYPDHPAGVILASTGARMLGGEELIERIRAVGGNEAADVMRRDLDNSTEETLAEWRRVVGPLMYVNPNADPLVPIFDDARITTMQVNLAWFENEGNTMDLRPDLVNVRCPTLVLVGEHDPMYPSPWPRRSSRRSRTVWRGCKWCRTQRTTS